MDVLIVLGTTASYSYSVFAMLFALFCTAQCARPSTSFETSTMLITFVTFGRYLENTAKGKTSEALSKLIGLAPSQAVIYTDGEKMTQERKVASDLIQRGDYVKVIPGERIAADGLVIRGSSSVDESMITGEALPVFKVAGSAVIGGTVNTLGTFDFVVTRAGKETSLSQIVRLVSDAQTSKAPIQAFADRVAGIFVPSVVLLGAFTFIFWMCISHALQIPSLPEIFQQQGTSKLMVCLKLCISVVVVACPCALGLSTPTAVMVGTGVGAQNGILIKGGGPLEASRSITHILFDKTGTLTQGRLSVAAMCWHDGEVEDLLRKPGSEEATVMRQRSGLDDKACVSGLTRAQVLEVIGAAERKSEHPLARSIQMFIDSNVGTMSDVSVNTFESVLGQGIRSSVTLMGTKHAVAIGNAGFVAKQQASVLQPVQAFVGQEESQGRTAVYAIIDGSLACAFSLSDQLKPEARQAIDGLRRMGIHCAMVTGDSRSTAMAIATALDIEQTDVHAEMSPMGKREIVSRLRQQNALSRGGVAFVGDGINDSPALAAASLGIAVASGAEIAMEAASIVLMRSNLLDVPASLHLSRRIFRQIKLNFVWATAYNVLFIPLAMGFGLPWGLHLHPMMAGAAMAFSSVSVVLSSLTLKLWRRPSWLAGHDETTKTAYSVGNLFSNWFASARPTKALRQGYESVPMETV
jgi:Cu+-exporting ATPase